MAEHSLSPMKRTIVGVQFMFVAFGSTVLVPILCNLDPAVALLAAGLGTLLFHLVTGGKVPIYLGSSFAYHRRRQGRRLLSWLSYPEPGNEADVRSAWH